jgi:hypothetical protein
MGDQSLSRPLEELIAQQVDISEMRALLLAPRADARAVIGRFWESWRQIHASQTH